MGNSDFSSKVECPIYLPKVDFSSEGNRLTVNAEVNVTIYDATPLPEELPAQEKTP